MKVHVLTIAIALSSGTGMRAQEPGVRTFNAQAVDRTNHDPIPFATVCVEGTTITTLTDMDGLLTLELPVQEAGEQCYLTIKYIGYQPLRFRVPRADKGRLRIIELRRVKFDLEDPPVIRYGKDGPPPLIER
jgi:hypothetical protein